MEIILSAVLGELTTRSINFIIGRHSKLQEHDVKDRLRRALLRAQVILDEAMGRNITNQAMLKQLDMLRDNTYRGYFKLDSFRYQGQDKEEVKDENLSYYSILSKVNYVKDFCSSSRTSTYISEELQEVLDSLSSIIVGSNELVLFLKSYPCMYRQPYSMHLLFGNCMFGRQMETEFVIDFLLRAKPHRAEELEVLPIVGAGRVGKSTFVAHICKDERVRDQFSKIIFLSDNDFRDERLSLIREGCAVEYQNCTSNKDGKLLFVIEVAGDLTEYAWKKWCSASKACATTGTKIIITSRYDKIAKLGTTGVITLKPLPNEAYWYFFKMLTFGSTDPEEHPKLAYLAMEIASKMNGSFIHAHITSRLLRGNFDIRFWCKVLALLKGFEQHAPRFGGHTFANLKQNRSGLGRMGEPSAVVIRRQYRRSSQEEVPILKVEDLMFGIDMPDGKFVDLAWKSPLPPYYSYVYTCEIKEIKPKAAKRKRSVEDGVTLF